MIFIVKTLSFRLPQPSLIHRVNSPCNTTKPKKINEQNVLVNDQIISPHIF